MIVSVNMSSKGYRSRSDLPLDEIYVEVMDHMKTHGHFDNVRVSLIDRIWSHPCIKNIEETFESECEKWCQDVDLSQDRQTLRSKLTRRFDSYSRSRHELKAHIGRCLQEQSDEVKSKYYEHARKFLERYLPKPSPDPEDIAMDNNIDNTPQQKSPEPEPEPHIKQEIENKIKIEQDLDNELQADIAMDMDMDMDIESISPKDDDDEEVEKPPYSPIGNSEESMDIIKEPIMTTPSLDDIPIPPEDDYLEDTKSLNHQEVHQEEKPEIKKEIHEPSEEDLSQQDDKDDDKDTFSSISTVGTADLSDFDESITLSDVEARVIGKPMNSKIPIKEIQDNIKEKKNDLQNTNITIKTEQTETNERNDAPELVETSESDGGCSESTTTGRRLGRTRKSNPKYSNEHYIQ